MAFEDWPLPEDPFDAVVSATVFGWIDPAVRVSKAADAMRLGGVLATVATHHVAGGSDAFFAEVQKCYEQLDPSTPPGLQLLSAAAVPPYSEELDRSGRFGPAVFLHYEWELTYSPLSYLDLLSTYSGHRALAPTAREGLLNWTGSLIDQRHDGRVIKRYLTELQVAQRIG
ncbi:class I SAM-dependent methyltransferase [Spirillospora sp. NPDC048832]